MPALLPPSYPPSSYNILPLHPPLQTSINTPFPKPKPKTDCNCTEQTSTKQRRTPTIMVRNRPTFLDLIHTPQIQTCWVTQRNARNDGKSPRSRKSKAITKVEQSSSNRADEDREFKPGEESAFGCELDFWFDTNGNMDAWWRVLVLCWLGV